MVRSGGEEIHKGREVVVRPLDRLMRMSVIVTSIVLLDYRQVVMIDLFLSQCPAFPCERADFLFKNASRVAFDLTTRQIEIPEIEDSLSWLQDRYDLCVQKSANLTVSRSDQNGIVANERTQDASQ